MDCNQTKVPLLFFQDVVGFMVGKDGRAERHHSQRRQACERCQQFHRPENHDHRRQLLWRRPLCPLRQSLRPQFYFAWPNARYAVMGSDQASDTSFAIQEKKWPKKEAEKRRAEIKQRYEEQTDIRYGAARG